MKTLTTSTQTTGYIHLGLKNRLKLLRLALSLGELATIRTRTRYETTVTMREAPPLPEQHRDSDEDIEEDNLASSPMSWMIGLLEWFIVILRIAVWTCLAIEVLALDGWGIVRALMSLWVVYLWVDRNVEVEFGKIENNEQAS